MADLPRAQDAGTGTRPCWTPACTEGGARTAFILCPNGHRMLLDTSGERRALHGQQGVRAISANGIVMPSVVCPEDGCGWHEYVTLVGWAEYWIQAHAAPAPTAGHADAPKPLDPLDPRREPGRGCP